MWRKRHRRSASDARRLDDGTADAALAPGAFLNSTLSRTLYNELRVSFRCGETSNLSENPAAERIPSIEVPEPVLRGPSASATRTAIGLNTSHPNSSTTNNYQLQETMGWLHDKHASIVNVVFMSITLAWITGKGDAE